jgi:type IV secretion system protein VirB6
MIDPVTGEKIAQGVAAAGTSNNIFAFADMTASKFINLDVLKKILGLVFASPLGIFYVVMIFAGLLVFIFSLVKALILYLLALLAISLLLMMAPIFLSLMLFEHTRPFFDGWIKNVMNYTLQPVLVFAALSIFNVFMYTAIYMMLHYRVCWDSVFTLSVAPPSGPALPDVSLFSFYVPSGGLAGAELPVQLFMIFIFIIIAVCMYTFIEWMSEIAAHITTENKGTSLSKKAVEVFNQVGGFGSKVTGLAKDIASKGISTAKDAAMNKIKGSSETTKRR